jgi:hypothetical protein
MKEFGDRAWQDFPIKDLDSPLYSAISQIKMIMRNARGASGEQLLLVW